MGKIIGGTTRYEGFEVSGLNGCLVRIEGVSKGALREDIDPDAEGSWVDDEEMLQRLGGVGSADRVEVRPWSDRLGGWSFVRCDARATDLACFAHLRDHSTNTPEGE